MTKEGKIISVFVGVVLVGLGALIYFADPDTTPAEIDFSKLVRAESHQTRPDAKVKIVEFGDYECPACAAANPLVKELMQTYKDNPNVSFVFRHFPLPQHRNAIAGGQAAEAASKQGKFWEMTDLLYTRQREWSILNNPSDRFLSYAVELGLNGEQFERDMDSSTTLAFINGDKSDGQSLGVGSTPTFFVNQERLVGVPSRTAIVDLINKKLAE